MAQAGTQGVAETRSGRIKRDTRSKRSRGSEFIGLVIFAYAILLLLSLVTYDPLDPGLDIAVPGESTQVYNLIGEVGSYLASLLFFLFGFASFLIPAGLIAVSWVAFWDLPVTTGWTKGLGFAAGLVSMCGLMWLALGKAALGTSHMVPGADGTAWTPEIDSGGYVGRLVDGYLAGLFGTAGCAVLLLTALLVAVTLVTKLSLSYLARTGFAFVARLVAYMRNRAARMLDARRKARLRRQMEQKHGTSAGKKAAIRLESPKRAPRPEIKKSPQDPQRLETKPLERTPSAEAALRPGTSSSHAGSPGQVEASASAGVPPEFELPSTLLLDDPGDEANMDKAELMENAQKIVSKYREFSIEGSVIQIIQGPVVTTYEYRPDAGVKYSRLLGLSDDLALALKAESIRIDRIPGKSAVGIEVPNRLRETIYLKSVFESDAFQASESKLTLALGKRINGEISVTDLCRMPHLLIAGATGSGKSVAVNCMLVSILYRSTPDDVKLILVDPKRIELGVYADIPHLLVPVVTEPKNAASALKWAVLEMENRYKRLAMYGVRNIGQYNALVDAGEIKRARDDEEDPKRLPFLVIFIDEFADLMMTAPGDVEDSVGRLAAMARAVGIHLVIATQRPSVDVLTGVIKANFPSRISFRVSSKTDSRTVLDANGAELLLGGGDMLFLPPGRSRLVRIHGAFVTEKEVARLTAHLRKLKKPVYDESILTTGQEPQERTEMEMDELYDEAARIVVETGQASISHLQRRLRLGYSRAARLIDMMEMNGIIGAKDGARAREVLVDRSYFDGGVG